MKHLFFGSVALLALTAAGPARAADMPVKAPVYKAPVAVASPAYNWSGFYVGANLGGGWSSADFTNITADAPFAGLHPGERFSNRMSGVIGGGQIGYNYQVSSWVLGVEVMFDGAGIKHSQFPPFGVARDDNFTTRIRSILLVTGRVGYAINNWLPYVKGGYAGADVRASVLDTNSANASPVGGGSGGSWRSGGTVGAGIEYGFSPNWSAALEYDYAHLNGDRYNLGDATGSYIFDVQARDLHMLTGRINYRFGDFGKGPMVARY